MAFDFVIQILECELLFFSSDLLLLLCGNFNLSCPSSSLQGFVFRRQNLSLLFVLSQSLTNGTTFFFIHIPLLFNYCFNTNIANHQFSSLDFKSDMNIRNMSNDNLTY